MFGENAPLSPPNTSDQADPRALARHFADTGLECESLIDAGLPLPAYDQCIKASHLFNLLDARGVISVAERAAYIGRVRALARACCEAWLAKDAGVPDAAPPGAGGA